MRKLFLVFCAIALIGFLSCQKEGVVFELSKDLPANGWSYRDVQVFEVDIKDTTSLYDLHLNLRHSNDYSNSNVWLKLRTIYPSGRSFEAPVNILLAEDNGKWLGSGIQSILSRTQKIYAGSRMPEIGKYRFEVTQNMRRDPLLEMRDIGMRLEKTAKTPN